MTSRTRVTRTPSNQVEGALVDAAERLLADHGPAALTVRGIAAEAGVSPMGVYNHFGGKDGVVEALFEHGFDRLRETFADLAGPDARADLAEACTRYRRFALEQPTTYAVMFERAVPDFEPSPAGVEHAHASFAELIRLVQRAMDTGVIADADPTEVAQRIWSTCHGQVSLELRGMGFVDDVEAHHASLVETMLLGLSAHAASADGPASRASTTGKSGGRRAGDRATRAR
jgi:AcrR family transcriptional regulator